MGILRRILGRSRGSAQVEAAVLPGSEDVALRYPGEGVPRIISAATAGAIADAVNLRRRILADECAPPQAHMAPGDAKS